MSKLIKKLISGTMFVSKLNLKLNRKLNSDVHCPSLNINFKFTHTVLFSYTSYSYIFETKIVILYLFTLSTLI